MFDIKRLSKNGLLIQSGWKPEHKVNIQEIYTKIETEYNQRTDKNSYFLPQLPIHQIFPRAFEIIEVLEGITIKNLHPFSLNIYDFLERDIYNLTDLNGAYIFCD